MAKFQNADRLTEFLMPPSIQNWLPENHLARFVTDVVQQLNLKPLYDAYRGRGNAAVDPSVLLTLLFYGYATGVFSSRRLEKATYESIPFRFICGNTHPDHDTIANFRARFLEDIKGYFKEILLIAKQMKLLSVGNVSIDGSKLKANASRHSAMSYAHALELEKHLEEEIGQLLTMAQKADQEEVVKLDIPKEIERREERLKQIRIAQEVIKDRALERDKLLEAEHQARLVARREKEEATGKKARGKEPKPPELGPRDKDQYNFTDPDSSIMKSGSTGAFEQSYNAQIAVDQKSMLIVGTTLSNHANDKRELLPVLDSIPEEIGKPDSAALDAGYFSASNIDSCKNRNIEAFIAVGRQPHYHSIERLLEKPIHLADVDLTGLTPADAMRLKLNTIEGREIFRLRKCTVEPVYGIVKQAIGFRQFLLRGHKKASGEWSLVCSAFNLKRLFSLQMAAQYAM